MYKAYSELITIPTFNERFQYLKLGSKIGVATFGFERYLNQLFYKPPEWQATRQRVILRDLGSDLAMGKEFEIFGPIIIHHINPITISDVENRSSALFDLDNLVCVSGDTHRALHYSSDRYLDDISFTERSPFDTSPWRHL